MVVAWYMVDHDSAEHGMTMMDWCFENFGTPSVMRSFLDPDSVDDWSYIGASTFSCFYFRNKSYATMFKLTWL